MHLSANIFDVWVFRRRGYRFGDSRLRCSARVATADPRTLKWGILTSLGVYSYSTLLGGPLGEEPGWRGYALPRMEARFGPLLATVLLAVLWAGWHAPLFLYPGWTSATPWTYFLILLGVSVMLTLGTNLARFSIVAPIAIHAAFNTVSRFLAGLFAATQPLVQIPFTVVMAVSGAAVAGLLLWATKGWLGYRQAAADDAVQRRMTCER